MPVPISVRSTNKHTSLPGLNIPNRGETFLETIFLPPLPRNNPQGNGCVVNFLMIPRIFFEKKHKKTQISFDFLQKRRIVRMVFRVGEIQAP